MIESNPGHQAKEQDEKTGAVGRLKRKINKAVRESLNGLSEAKRKAEKAKRYASHRQGEPLRFRGKGSFIDGVSFENYLHIKRIRDFFKSGDYKPLPGQDLVYILVDDVIKFSYDLKNETFALVSAAENQRQRAQSLLMTLNEQEESESS